MRNANESVRGPFERRDVTRWVSGDPNGLVRGPLGQLAVDRTTGDVYQNTDDGRAWAPYTTRGTVWPGPTPATYQRKLVVVMGQSNALGIAVPFYIDPGFDGGTAFPAVLQKQQTADVNGFDPIGWTYYPMSDLAPRDPDLSEIGMGPELSLGRALYAAGFAPTLGKIAVGASSLAVHWHPNSAYPALGANLFDQAIGFLTNLQIETQLGLAAIVWVQGESDAITEAHAEAYGMNLATFVATLRAYFGPVAFVFNKLNANMPIGTLPYRDTVRAEQVAYAASDTNSILVECDDLPLDEDGTGALHYGAASQWSLGNRLAVATLEILDEVPADPAIATPYYLGSDGGRRGAGALTPRWGSPSGYRAGDLGVLVTATSQLDVDPALTTANGFTLVAVKDSFGGGAHARIGVWMCIATDDSMPAPVVSDTNDYNAARIHVFRNVDPADPIDVFSTGANDAFAKPFSIPGLTTTEANTLVAQFIGAYDFLVTNPLTSGPTNADLTALAVRLRSLYSIGNEFESITLITGVRAVAGVVGPTTGDVTNNSIMPYVTLALKPPP